ncbi:hypothetical protein O1V64_00115 (plasmid) [Rouxiella badensis]|uniref:Uncharacterized protein n=1 Tax=Rouxiella badensis TaxID=1646377 RepID=A0A1X0WB06_9GAMM|nr:hypothetical protein [Rouxiella badensis]ORJ23968.1 hypothetical protein BS640_18885 [Rouxiella badensis]WAT03217.1 hypothetical protein O1V64_00605 [Rouxiella badensis]WAT03232.1 hypothetical protein O1V64_00680 [Rouxiella badensis]WAT03248.1 hypothetical protein O1V64_00045 [Rouxiella badensis]WAT03262.1 hypothetical protein O1V64_00115 [Rouxiella badensis]
MSMFNTGNSVPSNSVLDLNDNILVLDNFINNESGTVDKRTGEAIPVLQEQVTSQVSAKLDSLTADAQSAITSAAASAADAKTSAESSATLVNNLSLPAGAGLSGYALAQPYTTDTVGNKLNNIIMVEDFASYVTDETDYSPAFNAAIAYANVNNIGELRANGKYTISNPIKLVGFPLTGFKLYINELFASDTWPVSSSLFGGTAMIQTGVDSGNINGIDIWINRVDGNVNCRADAITGLRDGMSSSRLWIGMAMYCNIVTNFSNNTSPNGTIDILGGFWTENRLGVYLTNGATGTAQINEGCNIDIKFNAANSHGGVFCHTYGQYLQVKGNMDYNGKNLAVIRLTDTTGLSNIWGQQGLKLTDGTTELDFMFHYTSQGWFYVVVSSWDSSLAYTDTGGKFVWTAGSTISCTTVDGVAITFDTVNTATDDTATGGTNYFDILHDYEMAPFGRMNANMAYMSGYIGGKTYTSNFVYANSFSGMTTNMQDVSIYNTGNGQYGWASFVNKAYSDIPFLNVNGDYVNIASKLYMGYRGIEGGATIVQLAIGNGTATRVFGLSDQTTDKYLNEGTVFRVTMTSDFSGCFGSFDVHMKGNDSCSIFNENIDASWELTAQTEYADDGVTATGVGFYARQESQPSITMKFNIVRF